MLLFSVYQIIHNAVFVYLWLHSRRCYVVMLVFVCLFPGNGRLHCLCCQGSLQSERLVSLNIRMSQTGLKASLSNSKCFGKASVSLSLCQHVTSWSVPGVGLVRLSTALVRLLKIVSANFSATRHRSSPLMPGSVLEHNIKYYLFSVKYISSISGA